MSSSHKKTAYSAFADVDNLVSKPVLGSDGAASWQEWKKSSKISSSGGTTAPHAPIKRADRLGTGMRSIEEERKNERKVREEAGHAALGEGYTVFRQKHDPDEIQSKKQLKAILDRIRPDDVPYFLGPCETFEGFKEDYVFTTRSRGTGYYWDGMDSYKKVSSTSKSERKEEVERDQPMPPKKKKKKVKQVKVSSNNEASSTPLPMEANNPYEQVAMAIQRRNEALLKPPPGVVNPNDSSSSSLAAAGWAKTSDPLTGKSYYYHTQTGETRWEYPLKNDEKENDELPSGWKIAKDTSGKEYFYNTETQETRWDRPSS